MTRGTFRFIYIKPPETLANLDTQTVCFEGKHITHVAFRRLKYQRFTLNINLHLIQYCDNSFECTRRVDSNELLQCRNQLRKSCVC